MIKLIYHLVKPGGMSGYDDRKTIKVLQFEPDDVMRARQEGFHLIKVEAELS